MWSQGLPYEGELDGRLVADGELVVPGRDASGLLQQADPAFDFVSALVHLAVEAGRAATGRASAVPVAGLDRASPGWCARSRVCAGRSGSGATSTPGPRAHAPGGCAEVHRRPGVRGFDQHLRHARTAHPRPNPKVRRSARSRSRRSSALQSYATLALYVPHVRPPLSNSQRPRCALLPLLVPLAATLCLTIGDLVCRPAAGAPQAEPHPGAQSRAGLPRSASAASASRQATPAITFVPPVSWPVRDGCPRVRVGAGHRLWPRAESGARLTPRTKHRRRSLSHEQRLELRKSAEQVGEAAHPVAHGLVRQREVRAGARLDTGEAPEDVPPRVPQPAADHEHKPAWT